MDVIGKLWRYWRFVRECDNLKSLVSMGLYIPQAAIRLFDESYKGKFLFDVTLRNENGKFFCGKNFAAVHTASSFHEKGMKKFFELKKGTIVDIGANIGKYSIIAARSLNRNGRVVSIEAEPYNFSVLEKNIILNNLTNVIPVNKACFSKKGKLEFYVEKEGGGLHSLYKTKDHSKKMIVEGDTLDNILKKLQIKKVDLIKVDVEQAEPDVLRGAIKTIKRDRPTIIFEAWTEKNLKDVEKVLKPLKYKFVKGPEMNYIANYSIK